MRKLLIVISVSILVGCAMQPKTFSKKALEEKLITINKDTITFGEVLTKNKGKKKLVQIVANYCPLSQKSFKETTELQKHNKEISYIFLSVDHSFYDWEKRLKYPKPKGQFYYISKKGKGSLGSFLKLKKIPRFLMIDEKGRIQIFKSHKIPKELNTNKRKNIK